MEPVTILLWLQALSEGAEYITRINALWQKAQRGEDVTAEDLAAARERTGDAMTRLEAAVKGRS